MFQIRDWEVVDGRTYCSETTVSVYIMAMVFVKELGTLLPLENVVLTLTYLSRAQTNNDGSTFCLVHSVFAVRTMLSSTIRV